VLKAEQQLNEIIDKVNKKYESKLAEKQRIKDELVKKIRAQEKGIEEMYAKGIEDEKLQLELLEEKAKKMLGKNQLGIIEEKNSFMAELDRYAEEKEAGRKLEAEKEDVQRQHHLEYLDFLNKRRPYSSQRNKTRIRKQPKSKKVLPEPPSDPSIESLREISEKPDLEGIVLFDPRAIGPLLETYIVE
jgi:hypothetical protein